LWTKVVNSTLLSIAVFLKIAAFSEFGVDCYVRGYVYRAGDEVSLSREDSCQAVSMEVYKNGIALYTNKYWVIIIIPDDVKGHESFWYRWGASNAYIHGNPIKVEWGYILKG
jgi:hypothetical protein